MKVIFKLASILLLLAIFSCSKNKEIITKNEVTHKISNDFAQGSEDIPLLIGMAKIKGKSIIFDSFSGSIMTSSYETKIKISKIKEFYQKTLPQMGWNKSKDNNNDLEYSREHENLKINFSNKKNTNIIKFLISYDL